jgi:hypothetical protein
LKGAKPKVKLAIKNSDQFFLSCSFIVIRSRLKI